MSLSNLELSKHRRYLKSLLTKIEQQAFYCAYTDPLIQGTPGEVFRTCGKETCKCMKDSKNRHSPYLVIQIYQDKKQKQIALKQEQKNLWQQAKNYQKQIHILMDLKKSCTELITEVDKIIQLRTEVWP
jgi:hypothetical protein